MALYFRTWKMAVAGLVALLHDLVITVGIYALAGFEITPASMIGFLTILGYSLYDTVVVFDKVRENTAEAFAQRAHDLLRRRPTSRSTRPWSARSTPPSWRCCRSPRSSSSASPCSARARCSTSRSRCSSASRSAPTPRSSSPRRCWSTCVASEPAVRRARRKTARATRRHGRAPRRPTAAPDRRVAGADCTGAAEAAASPAAAAAHGRARHAASGAQVRPGRAAQPAQARPEVAALTAARARSRGAAASTVVQPPPGDGVSQISDLAEQAA